MYDLPTKFDEGDTKTFRSTEFFLFLFEFSGVFMKTTHLVFLILGAIFSFVFVVLFVASIFLSFDGEGGSEKEDDFYNYRHLFVDVENNVISKGSVTLPQKLQEEEFLSFKDSNGNYVLISNFGSTDEYKCIGTCFCSDEGSISHRRSSVGQSTIKIGIMYLVAAISSIVAYDKAREYFKEKCVEELKDSCLASSVSSELDDCLIPGTEVSYVTTGVSREKSYWCRGNCLPLKNLLTKEKRDQVMEFGCEELETESEVVITGRNIYLDTELEACDTFIREVMLGYCDEEGREGPEMFCIGSERMGSAFYNPSIICFESHLREQYQKEADEAYRQDVADYNLPGSIPDDL